MLTDRKAGRHIQKDRLTDIKTNNRKTQKGRQVGGKTDRMTQEDRETDRKTDR